MTQPEQRGAPGATGTGGEADEGRAGALSVLKDRRSVYPATFGEWRRLMAERPFGPNWGADDTRCGAQCFNARGNPKIQHETREEAIQQKRDLIMKGLATSSIKVYECTVCGFWHVGHPGGRR